MLQISQISNLINSIDSVKSKFFFARLNAKINVTWKFLIYRLTLSRIY